MSWDRVAAAQALQTTLQTALDGVTVFAKPPNTLNPPCVVIGRPNEVRFAIAGFGVDEADVPVICVAAADGEDVVDALTALVRSAVANDPSLGGVVQIADDQAQRNWRNLNVGGVDVVQAEVELRIEM
jgi:hypothetical protein